MDPNSRGSAAVAFLLLATAVLFGSLWLTYGTRDAVVSARVEGSRDVGVPAPKGSASLAGIDEAVALSQVLDNAASAPVVPESVRFRRDAPERAPEGKPPAVTDLEGTCSGFSVTLVWRMTGDLPYGGIQVDRLGPDGAAVESLRLPSGTTTYRDSPTARFKETRTYRVSPLFRDQTVAGRAEKQVHCDVPFEVEFLGCGPQGLARFGVVAELDGKRHVEEFDTAPGGQIGGLRPAGNAEKGIDWSTGWRFQGLKGRREVAKREVSVPVFLPDGRLARDPETGDLLFEFQVVPMVTVTLAAMVTGPGSTELVPLLRKSED
jgi:hypothetical protein